MITECKQGDCVTMKKSHACGKNEWLVMSVGNVVSAKCVFCGRTISMNKEEFFRYAKKTIKQV